MESKRIASCSLHGEVTVPASKSDAQRAIICAGLASGTSKILNLGKSDDVQSVLSIVQSFGAEVKCLGNEDYKITGSNDFPAQLRVNVNESGLALRLISVICSVHGGNHEIDGEGTLTNRNHDFIGEDLSQMGVIVDSSNGLPLIISGQLKPGEYNVDGSNTSQFISGLLMALPLLEGDSVLNVRNLVSGSYIDLTIQTMKSFGVEVTREGARFTIPGNQSYSPTDYRVEGDWSAASYWMVANAIGHKIDMKGLKTESIQPDVKIKEVIESLSAGPIIFDATNCPDLFPALAALTIFTDGNSTIKGVSRLLNKESNRAMAIQTEFGKLGVKIELRGDDMIVYGGGELIGAKVDSHNDHRIAMCLAIAGTQVQGGVEIMNSECVSKSYPEFWSDLESLTIR